MSRYFQAYEEMSDKEGEDSTTASAGTEALFEKFVHDFQERISEAEKEPAEPIFKEKSLKSIAELIQDGKVAKESVIVMCGAGISTAAGIPDFRSPESGLYSNLGKYQLEDPQTIFSIGYFHENPKPFFEVSKKLFPRKLEPTTAHYFLKLLHDKGLLMRIYTQNIDTLEHIAGVPKDKVMEAHGSFSTGTCLNCKRQYTLEWMKEKLGADNDDDDVIVPKCDKCQKGVVKPDVVFFGEALPRKFFESAKKDFPKCELLIIMGTSLIFNPFVHWSTMLIPMFHDC